MPASVHLTSGLLTFTALTGLISSAFVTAIPIPTAYINFAGAKGNFSARQATFRVPDRTPTTPVKNGLRSYEIHLAGMIEVTHWFCRYQKPDYTLYWHYEANNGKIFMGQYALSCQTARQIAATIGLGPTERVTLHNQGRVNQAMIPSLNLTGRNRWRFQAIVAQLKPECSETTPPVCPGDQLSQTPTSEERNQ
ncbi:MAG: hypothetical protein ACKO24_00065 [Leptolyngbyaceae cyanobacterium]